MSAALAETIARWARRSRAFELGVPDQVKALLVEFSQRGRLKNEQAGLSDSARRPHSATTPRRAGSRSIIKGKLAADSTRSARRRTHRGSRPLRVEAERVARISKVLARKTSRAAGGDLGANGSGRLPYTSSGLSENVEARCGSAASGYVV